MIQVFSYVGNEIIDPDSKDARVVDYTFVNEKNKYAILGTDSSSPFIQFEGERIFYYYDYQHYIPDYNYHISTEWFKAKYDQIKEYDRQWQQSKI